LPGLCHVAEASSGNWPKTAASPKWVAMLRKLGFVVSLLSATSSGHAQGGGPVPETPAPHASIERSASAAAVASAALPSAAAVASAAAPEQFIPNGKIQIWTLGDSTAQPIAQGIERNVKEQPAFVVRSYFRNASGLARPAYFDWHKVARGLLQRSVPEIAVITFGANDTQGLSAPGRYYPAAPLTPEWRQEYQRRVTTLLQLFTERGVRVFLVLQTYDPARKYAALMAEINAALQGSASGMEGVVLIDTPALLATADGEYSNFATDSQGNKITLRGEDGLHLTGTGGGYLARRILRAMEQMHLVPMYSSGLDAAGHAVSLPKVAAGG
jgi:hypothetical protein